jgi:mRNA-degrading endonuclease toxin of MazEF toxin-antitoxin module
VAKHSAAPPRRFSKHLQIQNLQKPTVENELELSGVKLPKRSWVKISQIRTLSVERLGKKVGRVSPEELDRLIEGLNEILGA